jgi:hypothetical protein
MRLSDAIATGRHLIEHPSAATFCRCAIGMGLAAIGCDYQNSSFGSLALVTAEAKWPWLKQMCDNPKQSWTNKISLWFWDVEWGTMTLDELIDRVRAVEPPEPESAETPEVLTLAEELASIT